MKKHTWYQRLAACAVGLLFFVCLIPFVEADTQLSVSFAQESMPAAAGSFVSLPLRVSEAPQTPLPVRIRCVEQGCEIGFFLPAGVTAASVTVYAGGTVSDPPFTYELVPTDRYAVGDGAACKVSVSDAVLPAFTLGKGDGVIVGTPGRDVSVPVFCEKNEAFTDPITLTLVSESGQALADISYNCGAKNKSIRVTFPADTAEVTRLYLYAYDRSGTCLASTDAVAVNSTYKGIKSVDRDDGLVGLSFDCAYGEKHTDNIVSTLAEYGCTATFFMIGTWVGNHGPWIERIVAGGNEVGNHSKTHQRMASMSPSKVKAELLVTEESIVNVTGARPTLFRPPYGNGSLQLTALCHYYGYEVIYWTIDAHDWDTEYTADMIVKRVCSNVKSGDILLFHNGAPLSEQYLPVVLQYLADNGMKGVRISDMLYPDNYYVDEDGRQHLRES